MKNGDHFKMPSMAEATAAVKYMDLKLFLAIEVFSSEANLTAYIDNTIKARNELIMSVDSKPAAINTDRANDSASSVSLSQEIPTYMGSPMLSLLRQQPTVTEASDRPATIAMSPMTQFLQQQGINQNTATRIFIAEFIPNSLTCNSSRTKVVAFDVIDTNNRNTLWTHKPHCWKQVFNADQANPVANGGQYIDPFFWGFNDAQVRLSPDNNEVKTRRTKNDRFIQSWIMYFFVEANCSEQDILDKFRQFATLIKDKEIQQRYQMCLCNQGFNGDIVSQCNVGGVYWKKLESATATNQSVEKLSQLNKLFRDEEIKNIIQTMFGIGDQPLHMWPQSVRRFAYL
jgi:hypothetical protein